MIPLTTINPLEAPKSQFTERKLFKDSWLVKSPLFSLKVLVEAHRLQSYANRHFTLRGHIAPVHISTSKKLHEVTSSHTSVIFKAFKSLPRSFNIFFMIGDSSCDQLGGNYFRHQIFSQSPGQLKIIYYSLEKCPCQASGCSSIVWSNFTMLAAKQALLVIAMLKTLFPKTEDTVDLKLPQRAPSQISGHSNIIWPRRQKLCSSCNNPRDLVSTLRAHGWS